MRHWKLALVAFLAVRALTACATNPGFEFHPERLGAAAAMANAFNPPPQTILLQCVGCR